MKHLLCNTLWKLKMKQTKDPCPQGVYKLGRANRKYPHNHGKGENTRNDSKVVSTDMVQL